MAGGSRSRVTPAAAPEQPEITQLLNALSPRGPLPNLSSDQLPKDTHQVSGLSGSVCCTPSLVVWDLVRPKRFENRHAASVSRPFHPNYARMKMPLHSLPTLYMNLTADRGQSAS